jgi:hypothetical protein
MPHRRSLSREAAASSDSPDAGRAVGPIHHRTRAGSGDEHLRKTRRSEEAWRERRRHARRRFQEEGAHAGRRVGGRTRRHGGKLVGVSGPFAVSRRRAPRPARGGAEKHTSRRRQAGRLQARRVVRARLVGFLHEDLVGRGGRPHVVGIGLRGAAHEGVGARTPDEGRRRDVPRLRATAPGQQRGGGQHGQRQQRSGERATHRTPHHWGLRCRAKNRHPVFPRPPGWGFGVSGKDKGRGRVCRGQENSVPHPDLVPAGPASRATPAAKQDAALESESGRGGRASGRDRLTPPAE